MSHLVSKVIGAALSCIALSAQADTASAIAGVDWWQVPDNQVRYLPNYSLPNGQEWQPFNTWAKGTVSREIDTDLGDITFTAQGQYSSLMGGRVDRLDVGMKIANGFGARVGVLPYKTSWCRTYDSNNPWIAEPDAFCKFHGLNELAQGAFGAQVYHSTYKKGWLIDSMAGIYRPEVDGQSDKLGPYVKVGENTLHKKFGASINALHLRSGVQIRMATLNTLQNQKSDKGSYERRLDYDTTYMAIEGNPIKRLTVRASVASYVGNQTNPALPYQWDGQSKTLEAIYRPKHGHSVAIGVSNYTNITTYAKPPNNQRLEVQSVSLAWRKDWGQGVHSVLQLTESSDNAKTRAGVATEREGRAIGLRVAKIF
jgi:hypothetical protein